MAGAAMVLLIRVEVADAGYRLKEDMARWGDNNEAEAEAEAD